MFRWLRVVPMFKLYSRRLLSSHQTDGFDWTKQKQILLEPFEYTQNVPCKYHGLMAPAFNHWLKVPEEKIDSIQEAMQTFVTWTVLFDDIQDDSAFRYGKPSAYKVFGVSLTINAANKAMLIGEQQILDLGHPVAPKLLKDVLEDYFMGQGSDIYWRDNFICPTEEAHLEMTKKKCGSWFALPVALMQLFSTNNTNYVELARYVGSYYHIMDDYYNLFQPKALEGLARTVQDNHRSCSDITECKITLPIIHAMQFSDVSGELADILKQRTSDPKLMNRAISLLKKHGSDEYTRDLLCKMEAEIQEEIDRMGGNPILTDMVNELTFEKRNVQAFSEKKYKN